MLATLSPDLFLKRLCYLSSSSSKRHTSRTYALHPPWERSIPLLVDDARFIDRPACPTPHSSPSPLALGATFACVAGGDEVIVGDFGSNPPPSFVRFSLFAPPPPFPPCSALRAPLHTPTSPPLLSFLGGLLPFSSVDDF